MSVTQEKMFHDIDNRSPKVRSGIPLVRLRNPHGNNREWTGDWSDE